MLLDHFPHQDQPICLKPVQLQDATAQDCMIENQAKGRLRWVNVLKFNDLLRNIALRLPTTSLQIAIPKASPPSSKSWIKNFLTYLRIPRKSDLLQAFNNITGLLVPQQSKVKFPFFVRYRYSSNGFQSEIQTIIADFEQSNVRLKSTGAFENVYKTFTLAPSQRMIQRYHPSLEDYLTVGDVISFVHGLQKLDRNGLFDPSVLAHSSIKRGERRRSKQQGGLMSLARNHKSNTFRKTATHNFLTPEPALSQCPVHAL